MALLILLVRVWFREEFPEHRQTVRMVGAIVFTVCRYIVADAPSLHQPVRDVLSQIALARLTHRPAHLAFLGSGGKPWEPVRSRLRAGRRPTWLRYRADIGIARIGDFAGVRGSRIRRFGRLVPGQSLAFAVGREIVGQAPRPFAAYPQKQG
jgi:hypothetical protein